MMELRYTLSKFADDTKQSRAVNRLEGREDLDRLEKWAQVQQDQGQGAALGLG